METSQKIFYILIALVVIGLMAVFSASLPMCFAKHLNPFYYFGQHVLWLGLGCAGLSFFSRFDYKRLRPYAIHFAVLVIVLLLLVKFTPLGVTINGATRWLNLVFFSDFSRLNSPKSLQLCFCQVCFPLRKLM